MRNEDKIKWFARGSWLAGAVTMTLVVTLLGLVLCSSARADDWTGPDKRLHLQAGAAIGMLGAEMSKSQMVGVAAGCLAGLAKEGVDYARRAGSDVSYKDAAVTCAGAAIGSYSNVYLSPGKLEWRIRF